MSGGGRPRPSIGECGGDGGVKSGEGGGESGVKTGDGDRLAACGDGGGGSGGGLGRWRCRRLPLGGGWRTSTGKKGERRSGLKKVGHLPGIVPEIFGSEKSRMSWAVEDVGSRVWVQITVWAKVARRAAYSGLI